MADCRRGSNLRSALYAATFQAAWFFYTKGRDVRVVTTAPGRQGRMGRYSRTRSVSEKFDISDVIAIVMIIAMLSGTLFALLASRNPMFVASAQRWVRVAAVELSALATPRAEADTRPESSGS